VKKYRFFQLLLVLRRIIMDNKCAGDDLTKKAIPEMYTCPDCGDEVEIWTDETKGKCMSCGKIILKDQIKSKN
jgi:DNA-directed RNA polymerase subunit RPC12/RpoP